MSVFNQIKNFIRSSRNISLSGSNNSSDTSNPDDDLTQQDVKKFEAVARLVEEENLAKQRLPSYEGLERYKLLDKLGDGAFSNVYKALDLETQEKVAIKAVRKFELKPQQRASVLKEVQIMRTLKHPSIVQLKGFIETKGYYFIILELCEGGELFHQIVRFTYFSEDLARHCVRQVAEAIQYLHEEKGVVHRDIKPENLLFDPIPIAPRTSAPPPTQPGDDDKEDEGEFIEGVGGGGIGRVKIADFGLSKVVWDQNTQTPCGTVGYTAPEIVKDERYSKSVDMWALGCVLYTLLCGFPPFYDESIQVLTEKVAKGQYTFLSPWWDPISAEAKDLIEHLLCIDSEERYTIKQFMNHPWMRTSSTLLSTNNIPTASFSVTPVETPASEKEEAATEIIPSQLTPAELGGTSPLSPVTDTIDIPKPSPTKDQRRRDLFSGLSSMREIFDVSYAVHRMAEERSRRKEIRRRQQRRGVAPMPNTLGNIDSDDEDDYINDEDTSGSTSTNSSYDDENPRSTTLDSRGGGPSNMLQKIQRDRVTQQLRSEKPSHKTESKRSSPRKSKPVFELNMDNATLLGRRRNHHHHHPTSTPNDDEN
ncbi:kinase-like domain-containing protein [Circinella umbellata]|nr:kinase-like domain-containing protein [Circinella umbellata]